MSLAQLVHDLGFAGRGRERRNEIFMRAYVVHDGAGPDNAGPPDHARYAECAFPVCILLTAEWRSAAIRPAHYLGAVVGGVDHDCITRNTEVVEKLQQLTDMSIGLHHAV